MKLIMENWKSYIAEDAGNSPAVLKLVELLNEAGLDMNILLEQIALGEQATEQIIDMIRGPSTRSEQEGWPVDIDMQNAISDAHQNTGMGWDDVLYAMAELVSAPQEE